ncbi:golgin-45-like [Lineus longissimus]|uniref:golgin-45-like n=1 Tax=Lineus longissimus TaxID=88925 RepID=UPI00315CB667
MSTNLHIHLDIEDEMPPNAGIADQSNSSARIRAPRFIPWEPTKAATGPPPISHRKHGKKQDVIPTRPTHMTHPPTKNLQNATPTSKPDLKRLYPSPHVVYHTHIHPNNEVLGNLGVKSSTVLASGKVVQNTGDFAVKLQEMDRNVLNESQNDNEVAKNIENLSNNVRRKILPDDLIPESPVSAVIDPLESSQLEVVGEALKVTKPISVVDPMKIEDTTAIDINDLESREIVRLRRMNDKYNEKVKQIREERNELKKELEVQFQVNTELKKLLVASVGEDIQHRVERLVRERAQLANEIGDYCKRIHDDHENIDSVSIQADMWRSKYIASRMMVDELANTRSHLTAQYKESQHALQGILRERNQMRSNLTDTYRYLHLVKDSLQAHGTKKHVYSTNVVSLVETIRGMVEAIKFRLIGNPPMLMNVCVSADDYTPAEVMAMEIVHSQQTTLEGLSDIAPPSEQMIHGSISRYHPVTRYDHLTINCCNHCNGEILVI